MIVRFGTFLVRRGVISSEQLLEVIARQHWERTFPGLLAVKSGMLTANVAIRVVEAGGEFINTALEMGLLSEDQAEELASQHAKSARSLGALLLEFGLVTEDELSELLRAYFLCDNDDEVGLSPNPEIRLRRPRPSRTPGAAGSPTPQP